MESKETPLSYEDVRKLRLEENKKRMQELGLTDLSKNLSDALTPSKSPVSRYVKPRALKETMFIEVRRSSRVSNGPKPDYREVEVDLSLGRRSYSRSTLFARKYASDAARMEAANKAESLMKGLPSDNASFVKPMLQSHVTGGFWLGLPSMFCKAYLPMRDDMIVLEDEKGEEWETVYLANKTGLSGGWRGFSLDHGLVDGDALVFELVEPRRFKVHIIRASEPDPDLEEEKLVLEESNEKTLEAKEKRTKKKQWLVKQSLDAEVETNSEEEKYASVSKKGNKKRNQTLVEPTSDMDKAEAGIKESTKKKFSQEEDKGKRPRKVGAEKERESTKPGKKRGKEKTDELEDPFEVDGKIENGDGTKVKETNQITCFLRSKKPHSTSLGKAPKKAMLTHGDVIEVY